MVIQARGVRPGTGDGARANSDRDLAVFKPSWNGGGRLTMPAGAEYKFGHKGFFRAEWSWFKKGDDTPLISYIAKTSLLRRKVDVTFSPAGERDPNGPLLVVFGWYLRVMADSDSDGAVIAGMG